MTTNYDKDIYNKSNIFNNNVNSSRSFFGNSSKLENLQNLYFHLNPYSNATSIKSNQQLKDLQKYQNQTEPDSLEKKYAQPNINNYKRFHFKAEEVKKGKKFNSPSPYSPVVRDNPNMAFYSVGDLAMLHPLTYQRIRTTKNNIHSNAMRNNMRIQMVEEKMRKLEEKNDGLQVLNNLFFDSLKDNINQSLKRKAFIKRHPKDLEYLKNIDIEEYNDQVEYIKQLVEENNIDFDNYDDNGEPLSGVQNLEGKMEAMKTEIGTLLTKNTMKNDANLNVLRNYVDDIRKELEDKLIEFGNGNNKNFQIIQDYLCKEEEDRLLEKKQREEEERLKREKLLNSFIPSKNDGVEFKGKKIGKGRRSKESSEGEVSTESNKNIDVIDKMLLDTMTVTLTENEKTSSNIKESSTSKTNEEDEKEIDLRSESSKTIKNSKNKKPKWKLLQQENDTIEEENDIDNKVEGDEKVIIGTYKSNFDSNKPQIQSTRSKKSKRFKLSEETSNTKKDKEEEENEDNDETEKTKVIEGSYKSSFYSILPEIEKKSQRSKNSKKFKLSKDSKAKKVVKLKENEENLLSGEDQSLRSKSKSKSINKSKIDKSIDKFKPSTENDDDEKSQNDNQEDNNNLENQKVPTENSSSIYTESFKLTSRTGEKNKSIVNLKNLKEDDEVYLDSEISNLKSVDKKCKKSKKSKKSKKKSVKSKPIKEESDEDDN